MASDADGVAFAMLREIPRDGLLEAFVEISPGFVSELLARALNAGQRMLHVANALGAVERRLLESERFRDAFVDLIERAALPCSHVEDATGGDSAGSLAGKEVGIHRVVDEGEVTAGKSVSKDGGRRALHHLVDELRDDAGEGRDSGLMRAKNVEVTQADALEPIGVVEGLDVVLAGELLHGIG